MFDAEAYAIIESEKFDEKSTEYNTLNLASLSISDCSQIKAIIAFKSPNAPSVAMPDIEIGTINYVYCLKIDDNTWYNCYYSEDTLTSYSNKSSNPLILRTNGYGTRWEFSIISTYVGVYSSPMIALIFYDSL